MSPLRLRRLMCGRALSCGGANQNILGYALGGTVLTLERGAGEAGDDRYQFRGVDGLRKVELEAGAEDAHAILGAGIGCEGGRGNLSAAFRGQCANLRDQ